MINHTLLQFVSLIYGRQSNSRRFQRPGGLSDGFAGRFADVAVGRSAEIRERPFDRRIRSVWIFWSSISVVQSCSAVCLDTVADSYLKTMADFHDFSKHSKGPIDHQIWWEVWRPFQAKNCIDARRFTVRWVVRWTMWRIVVRNSKIGCVKGEEQKRNKKILN